MDLNKVGQVRRCTPQNSPAWFPFSGALPTLNDIACDPRSLGFRADENGKKQGLEVLRPTDDLNFDKVGRLPGSVVFALMGSRLLSETFWGLRVELSGDMDLEDGWCKRRGYFREWSWRSWP